jgi:soluble lytic murein transglycosylase-like protein
MEEMLLLVPLFENKQMNTTAKALVVLIWFSAPAAWAAEPANVREFSERCAASYASAFEVPVELVEAVIQVESGWNPYAVSSKGAAGLMQLMPATASRFGVPDRFKIEENIRGGVAYLAWLIRLFNGDLRLAVAAYQVGESQVLSRGLAYSSREVFLYVSRVAQLYRAMRRETGRRLAAQNSPAETRGGR